GLDRLSLLQFDQCWIVAYEPLCVMVIKLKLAKTNYVA
ncbi:MAG: hypothetical protein RL178_180, partial [Pseudomonadota bacterium]